MKTTIAVESVSGTMRLRGPVRGVRRVGTIRPKRPAPLMIRIRFAEDLGVKCITSLPKEPSYLSSVFVDHKPRATLTMKQWSEVANSHKTQESTSQP